jgi:hypothetical protein
MKSLTPREWRRPTTKLVVLPMAQPVSRPGMYIAARRPISGVLIENSCELFKAELGKNRRVLRPKLEAVDNISRRKKRVFEMQLNGISYHKSSCRISAWRRIELAVAPVRVGIPLPTSPVRIP